jgi:hypothetical protein
MASTDDQKPAGGVTAITSAMLDRLAELARGNEERTLEYLMMKSTAERQAELKARRQEAGQVRVTVWAGNDQLEALKAAFPGPRGGIDWQAVIHNALRLNALTRGS